MHEKLQTIAEQAGFVFWQDEPHGPGPGHIDWSSEYDRELEQFAKTIIEQCASLAPAHSNEIRQCFGLPKQGE